MAVINTAPGVCSAITQEDREILEATDPDVCIDTCRRIEFHVRSDKPGLIIRQQLPALLQAHGGQEVYRTVPIVLQH